MGGDGIDLSSLSFDFICCLTTAGDKLLLPQSNFRLSAEMSRYSELLYSGFACDAG